ncbi:MAG: crossover junction endodeoxyribonuclease RuvC [Candidatus Magasanikbacteria bacterium CG11_big_fil_rev_8_21_14_0_20_39_34]|uniref:Crossover junction endodeoxyribonuclease RuvC n=1 Tax=Candidatus Magasanikbacteria bacterium CG11_big_fil_rev_8_21_14_0_20_39_34 TaxID=1974653 RepID=A0A2H0N6U7_9BACT|nr:MAG: crossover junction endodeoxyribonuclease RuvC [Candidatus Magasanikbacteria bacterium CG11_big_fil_rev_8_21_14_0_20_39_34]
MRILGIDPGFGRMGFGVIEKVSGNFKHVAHGCIETSPKASFVERLLTLDQELNKILKEYQPTHAGVEELFFYKNAKTAIDVGQARGVILLGLKKANLPLFELTPLQVKQALVGYGRAEKKQVQKMVQLVLSLEAGNLQDDAADALAIAIATIGLLKFPQG